VAAIHHAEARLDLVLVPDLFLTGRAAPRHRRRCGRFNNSGASAAIREIPDTRWGAQRNRPICPRLRREALNRLS
jgi:hypothetical protein